MEKGEFEISIHLTLRYLEYFEKVRVIIELQKIMAQNNLSHEETHTTYKVIRTNITGQRTPTTTRIPTKTISDIIKRTTSVVAMDVIAQIMSQKIATNERS